MWRGPVELRVASFGLTLGGTPNPDINDTSERMEARRRCRHTRPGRCALAAAAAAGTSHVPATAARAPCSSPAAGSVCVPLEPPLFQQPPRRCSRVQVEARDVSGVLLSGSYRLAMGHLAADLHRLAGVQQLGGTLMALPFVRAPRASVR